jgi:hypothetical protein
VPILVATTTQGRDVLATQETEGIRHKLAGLDDDALLRVLAMEKDEYRPEAIELARAEARSRGLRELSRAEWLAPVAASVQRDDTGQPTDFCEDCLAATTNESPGAVLALNFALGTTFYHSGGPCPNCGSIVATKCFILFLIPVVRLGRFRLKYHRKGFFGSSYFGRKLRNQRA